jgi:hypothetical protein
MSNKKKELHSGLSKQGSLFDIEIAEGALDVDLALRDALSRALASCRDSRYQVAAKISELTRHNLSKDMLDKYISSNTDYDFKAKDLAAFCAVTGSLEPFRVLLAPLGCEAVDPEDSKYVKLAKMNQNKARLLGEIARLEQELGIKTKL